MLVHHRDVSKLPRDRRRERHRQWLEREGEHLAALAWIGYLHHGLGALLVRQPPSNLLLNSWSPGSARVTYLPVAREYTRDKNLPPTVQQVLSTMGTQYHPTREIVVIFVSRTGSLDVYRLDRPAGIVPPSAYQRLQWRQPLPRR
jgi:hypothetical protein